MNPDDRRSRRTRAALQGALVRLLAEKPLEAVTVRELAEAADVHRATFYSHYQDIYDLHAQVQSALVAQIEELVSGWELSYGEFYARLVRAVRERPDLFRLVLTGSGSPATSSELAAYLERRYLEVWCMEVGRERPTQAMALAAAFQVTGLLAVLGRSVEGGFTEPEEGISRLLAGLEEATDRVVEERGAALEPATGLGRR